MRNVAIVNSVHKSSTGKIGSGLHKYLLQKGYNSFFCYGRGLKQIDETHYRIDRVFEFYLHALLCRLFGAQGFYSQWATRRLLRFLKTKRIDTIYGIGLHGYYLNEKLFFDFIVRNNIRFIYIMADEYPFLGKCGYSNGCTNYLSGCGNCPQKREYPRSLFFDRSRLIYRIKQKAYSQLRKAVFVGPEYTIIASKKSPLMRNIKTDIVDEAIDINLYYPREVAKLKKQLNIAEEKIILVCVAPLSYERKGCKYFMQAAEALKNDHRFIFVHVGYTGDISLCPDNYIPVGFEANQSKLAEYYSLADLFVFPSLLDTMPNACLEALACGSPLLCFNISGMPYIADETTATFIEAKNVSQMVDVIKKTRKKSHDSIDTSRAYAVQIYDNQKYYENLLDAG